MTPNYIDYIHAKLDPEYAWLDLYIADVGYASLHGLQYASGTYAASVIYPQLLEPVALPALLTQARQAAETLKDMLGIEMAEQAPDVDMAEHFAGFPVLTGLIVPAATEMAVIDYEQAGFDLPLLIIPKGALP